MFTEFENLLARLSADDRDSVVTILGIVIATLVGEKGTAVLLADPAGDGVAVAIGVGNERNIPRLLASAAVVGAEAYGRPEGAVMQ